jgi:hypothetical protein
MARRCRTTSALVASLVSALALAAGPALAGPPPTLTGEFVQTGAPPFIPLNPPDYTVDCGAARPFLQWTITAAAGVADYLPPAPYPGEFRESARSWSVTVDGVLPRQEFPGAPAGSDPQMHFQISDAGGLRISGVEAGGGGLECEAYPMSFDDEGHVTWWQWNYRFGAAPTYMAKLYTTDGTYVDRGTSSLQWFQQPFGHMEGAFEETWQSSLPATVPAAHVSATASDDRVLANGRLGSPPVRFRVRARSSPTGEAPVGSVRIRSRSNGVRQRFAGTVACLDVMDGDVGVLAQATAPAAGGALIHLQDGGSADRVDVRMLSAGDFARQQAVGCAPVSEPSTVLQSGRVSVTDALP